MNTEALRPLALDLRQTPPRSPHDMLGGFVIAARSLDKCRAFLLGQNGDYNFDPCGLAAFLWDFTGIRPEQFKEYVATGASDEEVGHWLRERSQQKNPLAITRWNLSMKDRRISELPDRYQEYLADYISKNCPHPNAVRFFFDVYDSEEGRL